MTHAAFSAYLRRHMVLAIQLALTKVDTVAGALRIFRAEQDGANRVSVLRAAERRVAELRGEQAHAGPQLVIVGEAVDPDQRAWEARTGTRIVAGTLTGRKHTGW